MHKISHTYETIPQSSSLHKHQQAVSDMDSSKKLTLIYTWQNKNMIFWIFDVKLISSTSGLCPELPPKVTYLTSDGPLKSN